MMGIGAPYGFFNSWCINLKKAPTYKQAVYMKNMEADINTFSRYANIAAHRVDFEGAPPTVSTRVVRESLLWYPITIFFVVGDSTICLPGNPSIGGFNAAGNFASGIATAKNGENYQIRFSMPGTDESKFLLTTTGGDIMVNPDYEGTYIRANDMCFPFINRVLWYSRNVADLLRSVENNIFLVKHPVIVPTTVKGRKTMLEWIRQTEDNYPYQFLFKNSDGRTEPDDVKVQNLDEQGTISKSAMEMIDWLEQRFYGECGIENMGSQVDKKGENMINAEVSASDDITNFVTQGLVDYINDELEVMGVKKLPGMENFRCVPRKGISNGETDDIRGISGEEPDAMADEPADD